jgi:hypothetical protein
MHLERLTPSDDVCRHVYPDQQCQFDQYVSESRNILSCCQYVLKNLEAVGLVSLIWYALARPFSVSLT